VLLGGGAATIRQYLRAELIDEMHFTISPMLLGSGVHLFAGIDAPSLRYGCAEPRLSVHQSTPRRKTPRTSF
jgi:dihydrofolate reductase